MIDDTTCVKLPNKIYLPYTYDLIKKGHIFFTQHFIYTSDLYLYHARVVESVVLFYSHLFSLSHKGLDEKK